MHNTKSENLPSIKKDGLKSYDSRWVKAKWEDSTSAIRWTLSKDHNWFGWNQIYFRVPKSEAKNLMVNDTEIMIYRDIKPDDIVAINPVASEKVWTMLWKNNKAEVIDYFQRWVDHLWWDGAKKKFADEYWLVDEWEMFEKAVWRK